MEAALPYKLRKASNLVQERGNILNNKTIWKISKREKNLGLDEEWKSLLQDMEDVHVKIFAISNIGLQNPSRELFDLLNNINFTLLIELSLSNTLLKQIILTWTPSKR